ncbi:MAG: DEAD/DEAH box helicase family protein [Fimbriimonadaceae bacterium]|nr:DEAD/DEAH box helicase family protein [Fimbriimonadaceae bacterium]
MNQNAFQKTQPNVSGNELLRIPQREGYHRIREYFAGADAEREVGVVLPVGCGKSGLIALTPFALTSKRALVIAPNLKIAEQLRKEFLPSNQKSFYLKCSVVGIQDFPEPCEIRGKKTNLGDIESADVVITNIQQLQGEENKWLAQLDSDFFDLILFDEGHHNVADSWDLLRDKFPDARIVNFSATPLRADGKKMRGEPIYYYSIFDAIQNGYVKRLKAIQLNPKTLRYVKYEGGKEIEVELEDVIRLAKEDANFRRGVLLSKESLATIVDASIQELNRIRTETGDNKHKIIAAALNYEHCAQVVAAYKARGMRADYVHSIEDSKANDKVLSKLENNEIDVVVQVRKLGEGFDHPYLSVAAVCAIFASLAPFAQFVGRIMRVIDQNNPESLQNHGSVIYHAGTNIAPRWNDFKDFSGADQEFFEQLTKEVEFVEPTHEVSPSPSGGGRNANAEAIDVRNQTFVYMEELQLLEDENSRILEEAKRRGILSDDQIEQLRQVVRLRPSKQDERNATQTAWDIRIKTKAQQILSERGINHGGNDLDKKRLGRTNFIVLKSSLDRQVNELIATHSGRKRKRRDDFTLDDWSKVETEFDACCEAAQLEVFGAEA